MLKTIILTVTQNEVAPSLASNHRNLLDIILSPGSDMLVCLYYSSAKISS